MKNTQGTGANVLLTAIESATAHSSLGSLLSELRSGSASKQDVRKVGAFALSESIPFTYSFALKFPHFQCLSLVDPSPSCIQKMNEIPGTMPLQAHVGTLENQEAAQVLEEKWKKAILASGGFHARGLHANEEVVYAYAEQPLGFLNVKKEEKDQAKAWSRIFSFFKKHLREI